MSQRKYTEEHEWVLADGDTATVGISEYAQEQLGDVVYVELPEKGAKFDKGDQAATVESVKAASEIYTPISGEVVDVNAALADDPAKVNGDPLGAGWFFKVRIADSGELGSLMDEPAYNSYVKGLA